MPGGDSPFPRDAPGPRRRTPIRADQRPLHTVPPYGPRNLRRGSGPELHVGRMTCRSVGPDRRSTVSGPRRGPIARAGRGTRGCRATCGSGDTRRSAPRVQESGDPGDLGPTYALVAQYRGRKGSGPSVPRHHPISRSVFARVDSLQGTGP